LAPYDIESVGEDCYRITMAVAGFTPEELSITAQANELLVEGRKAEDQSRRFLHRGIAQAPFSRHFELADFVKVIAASYENGLLTIELEREIPEAMKPRRVSIATPRAMNAPREERLKRAAE
jgi:molecular chaperone IbpA